MSKPRAMGNVIHQNIVAAEQRMAHADRLLEPIGQELPVKQQLVITGARFSIADARRILERTLGLGKEPTPEHKP